jgi:hypothetical protein
MSRLICDFDGITNIPLSVLAIPEHLDPIDVENELRQNRRFESLFVIQESIQTESEDLRIFLREYNQKLKDLRESKTPYSKSPSQIAFSRFHLFYHHSSVNNNKILYGEIINIKALDYKPFYDKMLARIEQQLVPIRLKTVCSVN